jgi:stage V sporulation protein D (sporulation-specific penicillin-binding protein)
MPGIVHKKRLVILLVFVVIVFLLLLVRIGYWTFYKGEWLQNQAEGQWTQDVPVAAQRGAILDRNGNVIAQSASADTILLRPKQVKDPDGAADKLSVILDMDRDTIYDKATDLSKSEVWLKRQITREQSDEIRALDIDGVYFTVDVKRYYPNKDLLCQLVGFTSVDGEGLSGLEKQYNKYLAGKQGRIIAETDKDGRELASGYEFYIQPEDGYNVVLSIDAVIQSFLEKACKETYEANSAKAVQGIVMDPSNGEILAMANIPGYDLNDPPRNDADVLEELSRNRVTSDVYEPGSTFKIVTTASALDSGAIDTNFHYTDPGYIIVDGQRIKCWKAGGHGAQDLYQVVQNSCNPAFVTMALNMGTDTFYDYIHRFGFGRKTGIDFISDQPGLVVEQKYVKNVDLARIGFGQSIAVTPLQLVTAVSAVVNGGTLYQPRLVTALTDAEGNVVQQFEPVSAGQVITPETSELMKQILQSVVDVGTGKNAQIPGYKVGGKTGTAQKYDETGAVSPDRVISSFIAFAPVDDPKYVVLILVDEPGTSVTYGSVIAAPYVKEVLEQTLRYDNVPPTEMEEVAETVTVPSVIGIDAETAKAQLEALGLTATIDGSGEVVNQLPSPDQVVLKGTDVTLYTAASIAETPESSENMALVPDVTGMTVIEARDALREAGFEIDIRSSGLAVRQTPGADEYAEKGSLVTVYFTLNLAAITQDGE